MKPNVISLSFLVMAQLALPVVVLAQTLQLSPSALATAPTHRFFSGSGSDSQILTFPNSAVHLKDYNTIQVTVSAPTGQAWFVGFPNPGAPGQDLPRLGLGITYVTSGQALGAPFAQITSASLEAGVVLGSSAPLSTPTFFTLIPGSGNSFQAGGSAQVTAEFAFTNLTLTVSFDNSLLAAAPLEPFFDSSIQLSYGDVASDPGPQLTLKTIPTPITLLSRSVFFPDGTQALVFEWANPAFALQAAPTATGPYTNISGATSPHAVPLAAPQLFFRLQAIP